MGIKKFSEAFGRAYMPIKSFDNIVEGKCIAIDMHLFLYKNIKAVGPAALTDSNGVPTSGLNNLLNLIVKLKKVGASRIIAVYDNPEGGNPLKKQENENRRAVREEYKKRAEGSEDDIDRGQLETRAWGINDAVIHDSQYLLSLLGIEVHITPQGYEAEHYCAYLTNTNTVDVVLSDDTDTVMFGSKLTLIPRVTKTGKYIIISLDNLLQEYSITLDELRRICITLGCDFAKKTPKIGPKTAFTAGKVAELSPEQKAAYDSIVAPVAGIIRISPPKLDLAAAVFWLSTSKGFNYDRITKKLGIKTAVIALA